MNSVIKSIYANAVAHAMDSRFVVLPDGPRELQDVINEKFAELVAQYCIDIVQTYANPAEICEKIKESILKA